MTDRQLLERAAKALGRTYYFDTKSGQGFLSDVVCGDRLLIPWNPLGADEDSMEMRTRFNLQVSVQEGPDGSGRVDVGVDSTSIVISEDFSVGQQSAATRHAVVRLVAQCLSPS